jgi:hypothetical protein
VGFGGVFEGFGELLEGAVVKVNKVLRLGNSRIGVV